MANSNVRYLLFDIESVADGDLISRVRYPEQKLDARQAIAKYRAELLEKKGSDFIPYTFQVPISVAIVKIAADFRMLDLVVLDEPEFRPHVIAEHFWRGWELYNQPTWVTFNGRSFDLPLMELAAFRYGITVPKWFATSKYPSDEPRNRYNKRSHLDLQELLTNFGASRFHGGLNLAANILGKPGKIEVQGHMVQDLFDAGKLREINDYCRCDVLDTYFVMLRCMVMMGKLAVEEEQAIVNEAKQWITERAHEVSAFESYLQHWGDWNNPWSPDVEATDPAAAPDEQ